MRIVDRSSELEALESSARSPGGQLVLVSGRRRVGKTFLLQAFASGHRTVFHGATEQSSHIELESFTEAVRQAIGGDALPQGYAFPGWGAALDFLTEHAGRRRLVVVLDEFPYLAAASTGVESDVQRWWDHGGSSSRIMLVLCGSDLVAMRRLAGGDSALHQRATRVMRVRPLDHRAAGQFVPHLSVTDRAIVYGVLGGTPLYLGMWEERLPIRDNLIALFGDPTSPLVDAAELSVMREVPEREGSFRILQAIALGRTRPSAIADYARVAVERPLRRLVDLGLVERRVPATESPERTRRAFYRLADPYFRFWFRFIAPARVQIARGLGEQLVTSTLPFLDDHMGPIFEDMAREHALRLAASEKFSADRVDSWWSSDSQHEIDIVGMRRTAVVFVGSAKWSARPLGRRVLSELDAHAARLPAADGEVPRLLYGRSGCDSRRSLGPNVHCFSLAAMYA